MSRLLKTFVVRSSATDAQLLGRFVRDRDDAAFAELVRRHGPLVLGVCRRTIADRHLADDAFQATFVVLARKAASIQSANHLGSWLYSVSHKVALRARTMAGRRAKHETLTANPPDTARKPHAIDELDGVLDAAIAELPTLYRDAVVLCELQGVSRYDAAKTLGIREGTLSSRLAKARKLLAAALARRGVTLPATLAVSTAVTLELCTATVRAATGALAPAAVTTLADGVLRMMLLAKLKLTAVVGLCAALLFGLGVDSVTRPEVAVAAPVPKAEKDEGLLWLHDTKAKKLIAYSPDGKMQKEIDLPEGDRFLGFTADGTKILFAGKGGKVADADVTEGLTLHLRSDFAKPEGIDTGLGYELLWFDQFVFSPDGKQIVRTRTNMLTNRPETSQVLFDIATRKETEVKLPRRYRVEQWSADGKTWRVVNDKGEWLSMPAGGGKLTPIRGADSCLWLDPSRDGKMFLATGPKRNPVNLSSAAVFHIDAASGKTIEFNAFDEVAFLNARWSPDGHRIGCMKYDCDSLNNVLGDSHLLLFDADGKNEQTLLTIKDDRQRTRFLGWFPTKASAKPAPKRNAPAPKKITDPGVVWLYNWQDGKLLAYRPNGDLLKEYKLPYGNNFHGFTPDGERFVYSDQKLPLNDRVTGRLHVRAVGDDTKATDLEAEIASLFAKILWSPDGKQFVRVHGLARLKTDEDRTEVTLYDASGKEGKSRTFDDKYPTQWHPDGKSLVFAKVDDPSSPKVVTLTKWDMATERGTDLFAGEHFDSPRLSPDGKIVLGFDNFAPAPNSNAVGYNHGVVKYDLATKKRTDVTRREKQSYAYGLWSPDGRRIAYRWLEYDFKKHKDANEGDWHFVVSDADGKNEVTIRTETKTDISPSLHVIGWYPTPAELKDAKPLLRAK